MTFFILLWHVTYILHFSSAHTSDSCATFHAYVFSKSVRVETIVLSCNLYSSSNFFSFHDTPVCLIPVYPSLLYPLLPAYPSPLYTLPISVLSYLCQTMSKCLKLVYFSISSSLSQILCCAMLSALSLCSFVKSLVSPSCPLKYHYLNSCQHFH